MASRSILFLLFLAWGLGLPSYASEGAKANACGDSWGEMAFLKTSPDYYRPHLSGVETPEQPRGIYIMSWEQGTVDDWKQVEMYKRMMLDKSFDYGALKRVVSGYYCGRERTFFVSEGHHRFAAALEIARESGDWAPFKQLVQNGIWDFRDTPPSGRKPLPVRSTLWTYFGWRSFLRPLTPGN